MCTSVYFYLQHNKAVHHYLQLFTYKLTLYTSAYINSQPQYKRQTPPAISSVAVAISSVALSKVEGNTSQ